MKSTTRIQVLSGHEAERERLEIAARCVRDVADAALSFIRRSVQDSNGYLTRTMN